MLHTLPSSCIPDATPLPPPSCKHSTLLCLLVTTEHLTLTLSPNPDPDPNPNQVPPGCLLIQAGQQMEYITGGHINHSPTLPGVLALQGVLSLSRTLALTLALAVTGTLTLT